MPSDSDGLPGFSVGERLTADDLNRIVERLRSVSHDYANDFRYDLPALLSGDRKPAFVEHWIGNVASTTAFSAVYTVDKCYPSRSANVGSAPTTPNEKTFAMRVRAVNLSELNLSGQGVSSLVSIGQRIHVFAIAARDANQSPFYFFEFFFQRLIDVALTKTSGADGGTASTCVYRYSAHDPDDPTITYGTDLAVRMQRPNGSTKPATVGIFRQGGNSAFIVWCDEVPNTDTCT